LRQVNTTFVLARQKGLVLLRSCTRFSIDFKSCVLSQAKDLYHNQLEPRVAQTMRRDSRRTVGAVSLRLESPSHYNFGSTIDCWP
jgi:hypothetical protein